MKKKIKSLDKPNVNLPMTKPTKPVKPFPPAEFITERVELYRGEDEVKIGDYPDDAYIECRAYNNGYWSSSSSYDDISGEIIIYQEIVKDNVDGKAQYEGQKLLYEANLLKYKEAMKVWNKESLIIRKELKAAEEELKRKEKEEMSPLRARIMDLKKTL